MKINRLDAHDRLEFFKKQSNLVSQGCLDCIKHRPEEFGIHPFYIYAHARTADDGVTKRLVWMPRLTKPQVVETNSMLFKYYPQGDIIKIIWILPDKCMWDVYKKGNLTEHKEVIESIYNFQHNRREMIESEPDDLTNNEVDNIYTQISLNSSNRKLMENLYT